MTQRLARLPALAAFALALAAPLAHAQGETIAPPKGLALEGIPPIPAEIAAKTAAYGEFRPSAMRGWHPVRGEILASRRLGETLQLHRVASPGLAPEPLTELPEAATGSYEPIAGAYLVISRAEGGNETFRLSRYDPQSRTAVPLSPEGERAGEPQWNHKGDRIVFTSVPVDRHNATREAKTTVYLADPREPQKARVLAVLPGGGWHDFRFSPDDRRLAYVERVSAEQSHLWVMEVASGKARRLTRAAAGAEPAFYDSPRFAPDGKGLFAISDRGSEYRHLAWIDLASGREQPLAANLRFDVEALELSAPARRLAFVTNEGGAHALRFIDLATRKELPRPALVNGVITDLAWRKDGVEIAFTHASAKSPGEVFSYDVRAHRVTRWTNGNSPSLNASEFVEPRVIRWKSFDDREITGLYYHPPSRFEGVRPVAVLVHGGPESQARAGFIGQNNYLVNELGIALVYPNVRGSSGFGKRFLKLDNGRLREDSVKDLGALLDWIRLQPGLDAERVVVIGGSYGGYMALAASVHYPDRIAGAVSRVGISNFVTFLERTETYRRDLRRVEYGDERDPAMRAFLESISPLNHAARISKPLFVIQGKNDPRVPYTEAEQLVASLRRDGKPFWYLLGLDEGHGFRRKANVDFQFHATVEFLKRILLK